MEGRNDVDVVVVGDGMAGRTAAALAARAGSLVIVLDGHGLGGRARTTAMASTISAESGLGGAGDLDGIDQKDKVAVAAPFDSIGNEVLTFGFPAKDRAWLD